MKHPKKKLFNSQFSILNSQFSILLFLLLTATSAWAQNNFTNDGNNIYTIHNATGWNEFCNALDGGETFGGKTVKLAADIGSAQAPVTRMAGKITTSGTQVTLERPFQGNFDGQNHTLVFSCVNATMNYVAPFAYVKGGASAADSTFIRNLNVVTTITAQDFRHTAGLIALQCGHVGVRNCHATVTINSTKGSNNPTDLYPAGLVSQASNDNGGTLTMSGCSASGTISTDGKYAGGLVGIVQGYATITNCLSSVTINSSVVGDGTHGGIVALTGSNGIDIYGCLFNGSLLGTNTTCCGGFIGWRNEAANIHNSLFAPATVTVGISGSATFGRNEVDTYNSYFTYPLNDGINYPPRTVNGVRRNGQQGYSVITNNHVAIAHTGAATVYNVSGITVYANEAGLACNNKFYAAQGESVSVQMEAGYLTSSTPTVTGATVSMSGSGPWSFTMPAANVTVSVNNYGINTAHFSQSGNEYTVHTATGWGVFCDCLADNTTYSRFSGKTVKLETDITVSRKAGYSQHDFCGTFDGQGHTLTFNYGTAGNPTTDLYVAPFCYISNDNNAPATIRNLHVNGDIYTSAKHAAGIVGQHWGTLNIENCRSSIVIHSSVGGDGTHGGIEAVNSGTLNVEGCVFDGKILTTGTTATTNCGGFVGWNAGTISISNSLYIPATIDSDETEVSSDSTFVRNGLPGTNCYYTRILGTAQGKQPHTVTAGEYVMMDAIALTGDTTIYSVSGITAYSGGGLEYGGNLYYGKGDAVSLTLGFIPSNCYEVNGYLPSAGTLSGNDNPYTLIMPDEDVTVSATYTDLGLHSVELTIAGCSESRNYDGTALTGNRFVVTEGSYLPVTVDAGHYATLSNGDILRVSLSSGSITDAGTLDGAVVIDSYTILNDDVDLSCHYNITTAAGSLTVTPQPVLITVNDAGKEYGDADPTFTGSVTGLINEGDLGNIEYYKTDNALEQIGDYPDVLSARYTPNPNYEVTIDKGNLTINCRNIITRISQGLRDTTGIDDCFSATNTSVLPDADSVKTLIGKNVTGIAADEYSVEITDVAIESSSCNWKWERTYTITTSKTGYCPNESRVLNVSGGDQTPPEAANAEVIKDTLWAYTQRLRDSIHVINDLDELVSLFDLSDECSGNNISLVSKTRTFKAGDQGNHRPDTVVVAYTVADTYGNAKTFYHAQIIRDTITVDNLAELKALRNSINTCGSFNYKGRHLPRYAEGIMFSLSTDLDLNGESWEPIGSVASGSRFSGTFLGNGHTIDHLSLDKSTTTHVGGLFGVLSGEVCGLHFTNLTATNSVVVAGAVCALMDGATIKNCTVKGRIETSSANNNYDFSGIGGIAGASLSTLTENNTWTSDDTIRNCVNYADIILGLRAEVGGRILQPSALSPQPSSVGGIIGHGGVVVDCANAGDISGGSECGYIGGIGGDMTSALRCFNTGRVTIAEAPQAIDYFVGGVVGKNEYDSTIMYCYNAGTVDGSDRSPVGGIVGYGAPRYCYMTNTVTGRSQHLGSIAGTLNPNILHCYYDKRRFKGFECLKVQKVIG